MEAGTPQPTSVATSVVAPDSGDSLPPGGVWMEIGGRPFGCSMIWVEQRTQSPDPDAGA